MPHGTQTPADRPFPTGSEIPFVAQRLATADPGAIAANFLPTAIPAALQIPLLSVEDNLPSSPRLPPQIFPHGTGIVDRY